MRGRDRSRLERAVYDEMRDGARVVAEPVAVCSVVGPDIVPEVPHGYEDEDWRTTKAALRALLIGKARSRSVVPYSAVVNEIGPIAFDPNSAPFHRMLDEVSTQEDAAGRGLLTVVVVHKHGDMRPGPGFFELAKARGRDVVDIDKTWLAELDRVWGYWKEH